MTDHIARLYAAVLAIVAFFLTWAVIAARPWMPEEAAADPRLAALERREQHLRRESVRVQRAVDRRFAAYRVRLAEQRRETAEAPAAPPPSVGVATVPPITSTRSS